jgi:hypothetical protein
MRYSSMNKIDRLSGIYLLFNTNRLDMPDVLSLPSDRLTILPQIVRYAYESIYTNPKLQNPEFSA